MTLTASTRPAEGTGNRQPFDRPAAVTRSLLGYGPLAGVLYLVSGLTQALTRDGFDLTRHDLSLLANGPLGWMQISTLVLSGLMTVAAAVGVRRALGGTWGPGLLAGYGLALVAAAVFVADPMDGFPLGTPVGPPAEISTAGLLHMAAGGLGFGCLVAATLVLGRRFAHDGRGGWAVGSRATAVVVLLGFLGVASGSTSSLAVLGLWIGVVTGWAWLGAVSVHLYRRTPHPKRAQA
jgi:hypothetical protein